MHIARRALFALIFFIPLPLVAQYASDAEKGFNAGQAYDTSDFDAVNVWTGNLVVNIPIISYPQRGKVPSFGLSLVYNGKSWQQVQPIKTQEANWKFTGDGVQLVYAPAYGEISGHVVLYDTDSYYYHQIGDSYGTIHDSGGGVAMDGSGLASTSNGGVRDRDGILYGNWGAVSDPEGNTITPNLSTNGAGSPYLTGWNDTVGRVIPAPSGVAYMTTPQDVGAGLSPGCQTTSFPGESGGTVPIQFCYSTYTAHSDFQQEYVGEGTGTFTALSSVSLPNGTSWGFSYNSWGDLASITLPTGGIATYQWQTVQPRVQQPVGVIAEERAIQTRTLTPTPGSSTGVMTSTYDYSGSSGIDTVKVTNLAGDYVVHTNDPETEAKYYDHTLGLLKTVDTTYAPSYTSPYAIVDFNYSKAALPETITTTLPSGQVSKTCIIYDNNTNTTCTGTDANSPNGPTWTDTNPSGTTHPIVYGTELYRYEYDYGQGAPGPLLRATQHVYEWQAPGSPYLANNLLNAECLTTVYGPGPAVPVQTSCAAPALQSNQLAQTISGYDENNGSPQGALGNLTSVTRWLNTGASVKSQTIYTSQGMPWKKCDPIDTACANPTIYSYDGTGLFPKSIQYPTTGMVQHIEYFTYDKNTGELSQHIDQNNQPTGYTYDSMRRLHTVTFPDGGSETYNYSDTTPAPSFKFDKAINASQTFEETGTFDGLGRKTRTQITSDPVSPILQDTTYDQVGRVQSISNPYRTTSDGTYGIISYLYDGLDRKTYQCQPDNTTAPSTTCVPANSYQSWSYSGSATTFTDENKDQWQRTADGLGRLTQVLEPSGSSKTPTLETDYGYNGLDNLTSVNQHGNGSGNESAHLRSFNYDSLGRLTSATNPETGIVCYGTISGGICAGNGYDANGNLATKTDAMGNVTTQTFDADNRLKSQSYSTGDPGKVYIYDQSGTNTTGRLTYEASTGGGTLLSAHFVNVYDAMGRIKAEGSCTITTCGTGSTPTYPYYLTYGYDLAGNLTSSSPGLSGDPILTYSYNQAGQLEQITSSWNDTTIHPETLFLANGTSAGSPAYSPFGTLANAQLSIFSGSQTPNIVLNRTYDNRGRLRSGTYSAETAGASASKSSGSLTISGSEQSTTLSQTGSITFGGSNASCTFNPAPGYSETFWDTGNVQLVVNGFSSYGLGYGNGPLTAAQLASDVAGGINNASSSPVTATSQGDAVTLTAKPGGSATSFTYSVSLAPNGVPPCYTSPDVPFTVSASSGSFVSGTVYDLGTITVAVDGATATASYGQGSSPSGIASSIASAINSTAATSSIVTATANGASVSLTSTLAASSTDWPLTASVASSSPSIFPAASFSVSAAGMSGGANAGSPTTATLYSYSLNGFTSPAANPGYDPAGNVVGIQDSVVGQWQLGYDTLNRLQSATGIGGSFNGINVSAASQGWTYDSFGNRTGQSAGSSQTPTRWATFTPAAANNRVAASDVAPGGSPAETVSYDGDGRLLNDGAKTYLWEMQGWLCGVTSVGNHYQYIYDAEGRLVTTASRPDANCALGTTTLADYIVDQYGHQITEADGSANWRHTNVYANGELLATYDGVGLHYALNDWLGDKRVQALASSTGTTVEEKCWNLPFNEGFGCSGTGADATEQHYTGKEHDKYVPQLDHFGARSYTQYSGRFLSPDWSGRPSAVPYASFQNPQSLNLYSYMRNNPLSGADPDGHCCWDWFKQQVQAFGHWLNTSPGDSATVTTSQTISYTPAQLNMARQMQNNAPVFALAMTVDAFALFDGEGEGLADAASAATGGDAALEGANYAQLTFSQTFSSGGIFAGKTVEEVAAALKSGTLSPSDVPIQYIVQDGNTLILNTRSAQALEQAGIPRSQWNAVNVTGDPASQARLAGQLQRNGLTSAGTPTVTPGP